MKRLKNCLAAVAMLLAACGQNETTSNRQQQISNHPDTVAIRPDGDFYAAYTGTIAGQPVVLHLQRADSTYTASYYYAAQGKPIHLYIRKDTAAADSFYADEPPDIITAANEAFWHVSISPAAVSGTWMGTNGKTYPIDLRQTSGAAPLRVVNHREVIPYEQGMAGPSAQSIHELLLPAPAMQPDRKAFVERMVMREIGCGTADITGLDNCLARSNERYADEYKRAVVDEGDSTVNRATNNHYSALRMSVLYNAADWLVLEMMSESYTGGAHGMYGSHFLNLDLPGKREWKLADIIRVDEQRLGKLLEQDARRYFTIPPGERLAGYIFEENIRYTDNIFITPTGIIFNYTPYEIAAYAVGEVRLFVPYTAIKDLLTEDFKKRINL